MSQENVEIVRRASTEFDETQRLSDAFAPDFVLDTRTYRDLPGQMEYHGRGGFFQFFEQWVDAYDEWDQEIEDVIDAGDRHVVTVLRQRGRLRESQAWVELHYGIVFALDQGLIRRVQIYGTPEEALEAAGLRDGCCFYVKQGMRAGAVALIVVGVALCGRAGGAAGAGGVCSGFQTRRAR
jgi:ketosteroid isomerase-like protein